MVSTADSECPNPACGRTKPRHMAFCRPCWHALPFNVQESVYDSFRQRDLYDHVDYLIRLGERLAAGTGEWPQP